MKRVLAAAVSILAACSGDSGDPDLSSYVTSADAAATYLPRTEAEATYLAQADAADQYLLQGAASATYLSLDAAAATYLSLVDAGAFLLAADADAAYLTQSAAASIYLTKADAAALPYLTPEAASASFLGQSDAAATYLTQGNAAATYLTSMAAATTYLTQLDAALVYLTRADAAAYLTSAAADATYLSKADAAATYQPALEMSCPDGQAVRAFDGGSPVCGEGPVGPAGPAGPTGAAGPAGAPAWHDTGCPGPLVAGTCVLEWDNRQATNFVSAASRCAALGGDLCTESQAWTLSVASFQNPILGPALLNGPRWLSGFADNDGAQWTNANGGTGDDHPPSAAYGYVCCGGATPNNPRVPGSVIANVWVTYIHDVPDTVFSGAVATCNALRSNICTDSQTFLLRKAGALTVPTWTASPPTTTAASTAPSTAGRRTTPPR